MTDVNAPEVHYKIIRDVACFDDELWVGTQSGVYVINELKNKISHIYNDPMCSYSLSDNRSDEFIGTEKTVYGSGLIWGE